MNAWATMLRQPALEHRLKLERRLTYLLAALAALAVVATWSGVLSARAGAIACLGLGAIVAVLWWGVFLHSAIRQNAPTHACLVPGLRRRLMTLVAALWATLSVLPALLFGSVIGHPGQLLIGSAALFLFIAACLRLPWIILPFVLATQLLAERIAQALAWWWDFGEAAATLAGLAVLLPVAGWLLCVLFPRGGDGHLAWRQRTERRATNARKGLDSPEERGGLAALPARPMRSLYARAVAAAPAPAGRATHLLYGLGPRVHWGKTAGTLLVQALATLAWCRFIFPASAGLLGLGLGMLLALWVLIGTRTLTAVLQDTAAEQAVLRLTPAAPAARRLNGELGRALLRQFGIVWLVYLACSALLAFVLAPPALRWTMWSCAGALAAALAIPLLRDYARAPAWSAVGVALGVGSVLLPGLALVLRYVPPHAAHGAAAAWLLATAIVLRRRCRRMVAAPPALPAGRMAA